MRQDVAVNHRPPDGRFHEGSSDVLEHGAFEDGVASVSVLDERLHRDVVAQLLDRRDVQHLQELHPVGLRRSLGAVTGSHAASDRVMGSTCAALGDDTVDETLRQRTIHHVKRARRAGGLTTHSDLVGIPAKVGDVVMDPFQGELLVQNAVVPRAVVPGFRRKVGMSKEAEDAQAVVDRDDDDVLAGQARTVVRHDISGSALETTAIDPDVHRQLLRLEISGVVVGGGPDVQVQAVLARHVLAGGKDADRRVRLRALGAEGGRVEHPRPRLGCGGSFPAVGARWRRGKGDALVYGDSVAIL